MNLLCGMWFKGTRVAPEALDTKLSTSFSTHGAIRGSFDPPQVWRSFLALFKLMNDDQSVVSPVITTIGGRALTNLTKALCLVVLEAF